TRNSSYTTPNFGTQHNEAQYRNTNGATLGQQQTATNRANYNSENRQLGQTQNRLQMNNQNRAQTAQNQNRQGLNQAQRGYGEQQHSEHSGAFGNYSQGGSARVNSARGQQSFSGARSGAGRRR